MAATEELKCLKDRTTENNKKFKVAIIACLLFWESKKPCRITAKGIMLMVPFLFWNAGWAHMRLRCTLDVNLMIPCFNYQLLPGGFVRLQIQHIASIGK